MTFESLLEVIGVIRGDDGVVYFRMLSHDMKQIEIQRLNQDTVCPAASGNGFVGQTVQAAL